MQRASFTLLAPPLKSWLVALRGLLLQGAPSRQVEIPLAIIEVQVDRGNRYDATRLYPSRHNNSFFLSFQRDDRRRVSHNEVERRRRDKINNWILKLGKIMPDSVHNDTGKTGQVQILDEMWKMESFLTNRSVSFTLDSRAKEGSFPKRASTSPTSGRQTSGWPKPSAHPSITWKSCRPRTPRLGKNWNSCRSNSTQKANKSRPSSCLLFKT